MAIASINPATGETLQVFDPLSAEALEQKLAHAFATFQSYRKTSFADRPQGLPNAARVLEDSKQEYGRIMTVEMGKTLKSAVAEAEKCASACRYYAENGARYLADEAIATNAPRSFFRYQPIGPVLAVMPWNFPFWQVFRFAAPALMAGNGGVLKHASNVPGCALAIESVFREAGFPENLFGPVLVQSPPVKTLIENADVAAVTLTGSVPAGRSGAAQCGDRIKKT